jgi:predicted ATP-binding protein involved in virulence
MKVLKAIFKNFIGFKDGMGLNEITFDFTNSKNRIILLKGNNGTGKTTFISSLHPFSGTFDERDSPIIPDKEGYKELIIKNNDNIYKIVIQYLNNKNKCYIEKNGTELNLNGNVRSYEELESEVEKLKQKEEIK